VAMSPRIVPTVIRIPRIHGRPPMTLGSCVIRFSAFISWRLVSLVRARKRSIFGPCFHLTSVIIEASPLQKAHEATRASRPAPCPADTPWDRSHSIHIKPRRADIPVRRLPQAERLTLPPGSADTLSASSPQQNGPPSSPPASAPRRALLRAPPPSLPPVAGLPLPPPTAQGTELRTTRNPLFDWLTVGG
jgi:hypothetical protein